MTPTRAFGKKINCKDLANTCLKTGTFTKANSKMEKGMGKGHLNSKTVGSIRAHLRMINSMDLEYIQIKMEQGTYLNLMKVNI